MTQSAYGRLSSQALDAKAVAFPLLEQAPPSDELEQALRRLQESEDHGGRKGSQNFLQKYGLQKHPISIDQVYVESDKKSR